MKHNDIQINQEKAGFSNDRCTVVVKVHYQEYNPPIATAASHAYDFTNPAAETPFQTVMRVSPSEAKPLNLGHIEAGKAMLALSHDIPKVVADQQSSEALKEAMTRNIITLTDAEGRVVGILRPRHCCLVEYPFAVFAQASHATAMLSITAIPVTYEVST
jgi:hypothetical protein